MIEVLRFLTDNLFEVIVFMVVGTVCVAGLISAARGDKG